MTKSETDQVLSLLSEGPKSSFQLCEELWQKYNVGKSASSKRLERLHKSGVIERYVRIERGAWIYYVPNVHSAEYIRERARSIVIESNGTLARVLKAGEMGRILSIFELGRIANMKSFLEEGETNPKIDVLVSKLEKLGFHRTADYLVHCSVPTIEICNLIDQYNASIRREADLLAYTRRLFIEAKMSERMTLYRQPDMLSIAQHKFDLFGHGGRMNRIRIVVECNLRREITPADLEGFSQRIGGTIGRSKRRAKRVDRSAVARYYIANAFSDEAKKFAAHRKKRIRLLYDVKLLSGSIQDIPPRTMYPTHKPDYYGRFKEARGIAFEAEIEPVYQKQGFRTVRRKKFFCDGNQATDVDTGKLLTDVDLYTERKNGIREIKLIECKSGIEPENRTKLFKKTRCYCLIADLLQEQDKNCQIEIVIIANVDPAHENELARKSKFKMDFVSPAQFYREHASALKGAPRWMFGL